MEVTFSGMVTSVSPVQPEKAELPMEVTLSFKDTCSKDVFPLNKDVTLLQSKVTFFMFVQPLNTEDPVEVGEHLTSTEVKPVQFWNA